MNPLKLLLSTVKIRAFSPVILTEYSDKNELVNVIDADNDVIPWNDVELTIPDFIGVALDTYEEVVATAAKPEYDELNELEANDDETVGLTIFPLIADAVIDVVVDNNPLLSLVT